MLLLSSSLHFQTFARNLRKEDNFNNTFRNKSPSILALQEQEVVANVVINLGVSNFLKENLENKELCVNLGANNSL